MPAGGGTPKRLTWHPAQDSPTSWTRDGKRILFVSTRDAYADITRLHTVPVDGGVVEALALRRALDGSYSPHGSEIAYLPNLQWEPQWTRCRGRRPPPTTLVRLR